MRAMKTLIGSMATTVVMATAMTAAAEDVYTCPVEDLIGFRKTDEGATAENKLGWAMDVDTLQPEDITYRLIVSDDGLVSVFVSTSGGEYMDLEEIYGFGIDTFQRGVLALSGGADNENGSTRFNFSFDVAEMSMLLHISSVYSNEVPVDTSMFLYTAKCS